MKTMKDYHDLYLKRFTVSRYFEKFRNNNLKNYGLCPSHYLSGPALTWHAMLNMTQRNWNLFQTLKQTQMNRSQRSDLNKYTRNSLKLCVLEVDFKCPRELQELQNDYPLAPDKIEIKREMLSNNPLKIADLYNIAIGNAKNSA